MRNHWHWTRGILHFATKFDADRLKVNYMNACFECENLLRKIKGANTLNLHLLFCYLCASPT